MSVKTLNLCVFPSPDEQRSSVNESSSLLGGSPHRHCRRKSSPYHTGQLHPAVRVADLLQHINQMKTAEGYGFKQEYEVTEEKRREIFFSLLCCAPMRSWSEALFNGFTQFPLEFLLLGIQHKDTVISAFWQQTTMQPCNKGGSIKKMLYSLHLRVKCRLVCRKRTASIISASAQCWRVYVEAASSGCRNYDGVEQDRGWKLWRNQV